MRLALWWISPEGLSTWDCEAFNQVQLWRDLVRCHSATVDELREQLAGVGRIGDFGSANDPAAGVPSTWRAPAAPVVIEPERLSRARRHGQG